MTSDAPAVRKVPGDCQLVGGGASIAKSVVKDKVFEMHQLAVDPEGGAGVGEVLALEEASADR